MARPRRCHALVRFASEHVSGTQAEPSREQAANHRLDLQRRAASGGAPGRLGAGRPQTPRVRDCASAQCPRHSGEAQGAD
eukprot:260517-Pleurochrysis_carterae.AAC.2